MQSPYYPSNIYSLGYWLKKYAFYPSRLPLFIWMDHGMSLMDTVGNDELTTTAPLVLKFSPRLVATYRKASEIPVYCILNPTIYCRIKRKYQQRSNSQGTLFYVAHSTDLVDDLTNWNDFVDSLKNIAPEFAPIDICLHPRDMMKGLDKVFLNRGYVVRTAGDEGSDRYADNMYDILVDYKYTMSNLCGSYHAYSVELGIPFSLYGEEPKYFNKGDKNLEDGAYSSFKEQQTYQYAIKLFGGFHKKVTEEQKEFVNYNLGKYDTISRARASYLLYKALMKYIFKHPGVLKLMIRDLFKRSK
jgi:hypothetical protein